MRNASSFPAGCASDRKRKSFPPAGCQVCGISLGAYTLPPFQTYGLCSNLNVQLPFENVENFMLYMMHVQPRPGLWSGRNFEKGEVPSLSVPETFTRMRRPLTGIDFPGGLEVDSDMMWLQITASLSTSCEKDHP